VEKKLVPLKKAGKDAEALQLNQSEVAPPPKYWDRRWKNTNCIGKTS
jgi:hypothetical protein